MKYAILSDIHAYPDALERVLADAKSCGAEKFLCLGDVVGYGPDPVRTIEIVRNTCAITLMGNHDAAVADAVDLDSFASDARTGVLRHRKLVDTASKVWLSRFPYVLEEADFACAHGSLHHPESFDYVEDAWNARRSLGDTMKKVVFIGHTHVSTSWVWHPKKKYPETEVLNSFALEDGCRYVVNVGSVGYPRHEKCSSYCLYDSSLRHIEFRRLPFDIEAYANALLACEIILPDWLLERLAEVKRKERS